MIGIVMKIKKSSLSGFSAAIFIFCAVVNIFAAVVTFVGFRF